MSITVSHVSTLRFWVGVILLGELFTTYILLTSTQIRLSVVSDVGAHAND